MGRDQLTAMEKAAYREAFSDGIYDLYFGLSLVWIGAAWLWLPDLSGLAGVLPAILVAPVMQARKAFVEKRIGYVRWSEAREERERRGLLGLFALGIGLLGPGVLLYTLVTGGEEAEVMEVIVPGLPALLIAFGAGVLAVVTGLPRVLGYAGILATAGVVTIVSGGDPGLDMFIAGLVITAVAARLLARFVNRYPTAAAA